MGQDDISLLRSDVEEQAWQASFSTGRELFLKGSRGCNRSLQPCPDRGGGDEASQDQLTGNAI